MRRYKNFNGVRPDKYVEWFLPRAEQILRITKNNSSFILNINDKTVDGFRHTYVFSLVLELEKLGFKLWERFFWIKSNPMPGMGGKRFRDATEYIFWFSKGKPIVFMDSVKVPSTTKESSKHNRPNFELSRSGHNFTKRKTSERFPSMVVPKNIIEVSLGKTYRDAGDHVAIYPTEIPEFFIKACTKVGDLVFDPFVGSGTTSKVSKILGRNYLGFDISQDYINIANKRINE